jgi:hypothetical protein
MRQDLTAVVSLQTIIAGVVCLVVGCLVGWMVFGWLIWPVNWADADPYDLRQEHKEAYISMVADSYALGSDRQLARERVAGFEEEEVKEILATLIEEREDMGDAQGAQNLRALAGALEISLEGAEVAATPTPQATPQTVAGRLSSLAFTFLPICGVLIIVFLIVGLIAIVVYRFMRRPVEVPSEVVREEFAPREVPGEATLGHFVTTYRLGDDGYDTSFNIETPQPGGEFYGACGVGFSEVIGEGSPDNIVAFEIWLFDKTDLDNVQTVTKVLASEFAFQNEVLRAKLQDRGEAVLVEKGKTIVIDAVGMQLNAEIVDFAYGTDPSLPPRSYFETLSTELVPVLKE